MFARPQPTNTQWIPSIYAPHVSSVGPDHYAHVWCPSGHNKYVYLYSCVELCAHLCACTKILAHTAKKISSALSDHASCTGVLRSWMINIRSFDFCIGETPARHHTVLSRREFHTVFPSCPLKYIPLGWARLPEYCIAVLCRCAYVWTIWVKYALKRCTTMTIGTPGCVLTIV